MSFGSGFNLLTIYAETKVDAGEDQSLCSDALPTIQLNGTISGTVTTGTWSGGSDDPGGYSNNTDLNSTYTPLMGEYGSTIVFTLTSDAPSAAALAAGCIATSDNVSITIDDLSLGGIHHWLRLHFVNLPEVLSLE